MLMNGGVYEGRLGLAQASVKAMLAEQWIYSEQAKNGSNYGGSILSYGLGLYQINGNGSARFCREGKLDFVGHTGEAFGLLSSCFFRPGRGDGFVYIMNGTAVDADDKRSSGRFCSNYIWEERLTDAVCRICFLGN